MNKTLPILALLLLVNIGFSQKRTNVECGFFGKKTIEERNKIFPFSVAKKVVLVAFPSPLMIMDDDLNNRMTYDSLSLSKGFRIIESAILPKKGEKYFLTEKIELNQIQINELSNLLINYKMTREPEFLSLVGCYIPRNAILFTDDNGKVITYIEICFQCNQFYQLPMETIPDFNTLCKVEECFGMVGLIKDFFQKASVHYGVVNE